MFERIEVLGATDFTFTLTAHAKARGWDAAFGAGVLRLAADGQSSRAKTPATDSEPDLLCVKEGRSGRGERSRGRANRLIARAVPGIETRISLVLPPRQLAPVTVARSA